MLREKRGIRIEVCGKKGWWSVEYDTQLDADMNAGTTQLRLNFSFPLPVRNTLEILGLNKDVLTMIKEYLIEFKSLIHFDSPWMVRVNATKDFDNFAAGYLTAVPNKETVGWRWSGGALEGHPEFTNLFHVLSCWFKWFMKQCLDGHKRVAG